ncbi:kinesin-like protein KIN-10C [Gastrolobium bilobum]|uniref:kinesin-like protein KIN-10C n=1 Tax=Gastrolobium bilobum TaxID=150636 RepID=UPI002AB2AE01|nr:kinesin-like protein KIN-10C [Gastrolobium bilobum]
MASNQFESAGSSPGRKVRVVGKVRGFSGTEVNSETGFSRTVEWVSVNRENSEDVTISFGEQSSSRYLMDYCYKEHEENEMVYSREVKPLVSAVFEGHNSTVIAHGAKGSGKTHLIQGSAEKPGLAMLAVAEFLSMAEKYGKSIAISFYEVDHQEHAVDLLNPEQPPILVFEDRGRIQFKGLTQTPVKSISEFQNLYFTACSAQKAAPKKGHERARRGHMGLIVHVISQNESVEGLVSKMNFVDLAGYEDVRKKSNDGSCLAETTKLNKSIYALLNVCHALSTNECRVPYRESKLTRMLQDSLRGSSKILLISCLNPIFCQDTIYMVSLASRSCQRIYRTSLDSMKKSERQMVTSHKKNHIPKSVSASAKKLHGSKSHIYEKKSVVPMKSAMKGRKLFDEASHSVAKTEKEISIAHVTKTSEPLLDNSLSEAESHVELNSRVEKDGSSLNASSEVESNHLVEKGISVDREDHQEKQSPCAINYSKALSIVEEGHNMNKENDILMANDGSPPISSQLRDLSNSLKLLCSSTPLCTQIPEKESTLLDDQISADIVEPKTPIIEQNMSNNDRWDVMNARSPWETFSMRGSGMKNSLVHEYLRFLNTANKEELKKLKGIGEKRATFILELREESPEPFKSLDDLKDIGLSAKQIKGIMKKEVGELFN